MIIFWSIVAVFAVYRVSRMLTQDEDGPFDLFTAARARLGQDNWIGRGVRCYLCVSFWLSLPAAALVATNWRELLLSWAGIAGAAVFLWKWLQATGIEAEHLA